MQIEMFPRLERFDVEFDLPEAFLPEFPPAIFLQNRPELGDVSRGEVVSINNFYRLFKDIADAGAARRPAPAADAACRRRSSTPPTTARAPQPSLGVTCLDCHVNGHTTGQFHLNPDDPARSSAASASTPSSLRGMFNQQIHGSKRSLRSVEDFTEFEQRTAYFNGDPIHAMKKGLHDHRRASRSRTWRRCRTCSTSRPRRSSTVTGRLDPGEGDASRELRGEKLFFGKAQCADLPPGPASTSTTRCTTCSWSASPNEPGDGPIKTFTLRGIKDSPPYLHDGRCLTLEDTVEFFNLVLGVKLTRAEKADLVAYLRAL